MKETSKEDLQCYLWASSTNFWWDGWPVKFRKVGEKTRLKLHYVEWRGKSGTSGGRSPLSRSFKK